MEGPLHARLNRRGAMQVQLGLQPNDIPTGKGRCEKGGLGDGIKREAGYITNMGCLVCAPAM